MKIAIIPTTGGSDPFEGMKVACDLGVQGVHLGAYGGPLDLERRTSSERREIRRKVEAMGLEISCLIGWGGNVDLGEEEGLEENVAWGKRLNETAVDMCDGLWMAHVGVMPEDPAAPAWRRFRDALGEIASHGEKIGAVLAVETGPEPPVVVRRMIEEVSSPALRVNFDPANLLIWPAYLAQTRKAEFDYEDAWKRFHPVEGLKTLLPYVVHVHAKDSVMRPDATWEEVPLGTGMTNWPELYRVFRDGGYSGYFAIERECGEDAMGDVRRAVAYLRELEAAYTTGSQVS